MGGTKSSIVSASLRCGVALAALALSTSAFAQAAPADEDKPGNDADIVVTGTLIRGTAAVGSQTITVDSQAITDKGASSTNEVLSLIPQLLSTFNGRFEADPRGFTVGQTSINKPNLRNFPSSNGTSGGLTLVLVDGMRLTPVGINASSIDPDIVPAAVLAGVDVVTDGGSSLYGADAVGGVLNFRTMKSYDGVKIDANYGFGTKLTSYHQWDGAITAGKSWSSGNAYISVGHSERSLVLNGEVPWSSGLVYNAAGVPSFTGTRCDTPQLTVSRFIYFSPPGVWTNNPAAPGAGPKAVGAGCDTVSPETYIPRQTRTNVFAKLTQQVADNIDFEVTAYWTKRDTEFVGAARTYFANIPGVVPVAPAAPGINGQIFDFPQPIGVGFSFGPNAAYVNTPSRIGFETWGITPELTIKLGGSWQLRTSMHYGRSYNYQRFPAVNETVAACYIAGCPGIAAGQLNPANVAAASAAVIADITNYETAQDTKHELFLVRTIADGSLFALPAGDVKLAVGLEFQDATDQTRVGLGQIGTIDARTYARASRNAKSIFGELSVPVFSFLDFSASGRYDSYSDFGSTFNPSLGLTLKPASWLKIYGHWNTSYNAPTPLDTLGIGLGRIVCPYTVNGNPGTSQRPQVASGKTDNLQGTCALILTGGSPAGLEPQTAKSWAIGFDVTPMAGLNFGAEFYSINLSNAIGTLNPSIASTYQTNPDLYIYNNEYTAASYAALLADLSNGSSLTRPVTDIAIVVDTRTSNLNAARVQGVDFHVNYNTETSFGNLDFGLNGSVGTRAIITGNGATTDELGHGFPNFTATSFVGWRKDGFSAKVTVNYTGKFRDGALNNLNQVEEVRPFVMTNLNLGYDFKDSGGPLNGTSFRVIVDNLFDVEPQTIKRPNTNNPSFNNWTLGRVIKFGVTKKF